MRILSDIRSLGTLNGPLHLAIGVFDGVHLGHQEVIKRSREQQKEHGGTVVVVTFDPHPAKVMAPERAPRLLTSTVHKARLFAEICGIEAVLAVPFKSDFGRMGGDEFIRHLAASNRVASISVGIDFRFGRGRSGNVELLRELGEELDFVVCAPDLLHINGDIASSTRIRAAVEAGDLEYAASLLGRPYTVLGTVIEGRKLGRTIGFPTANLTVHSEQLPPSGVYAIRGRFRDERLKGVANLGFRPTVEGSEAKKLLEVHLFDFDREIYGEDLEIEFVDYMREEMQFDGVEALKAQIETDAAKAKRCLR